MMTISSEVGQRLAIATHKFLEAQQEAAHSGSLDAERSLAEASLSLDLAGLDVGRELVASNFHLMECGQ